jgi:hypothetical protein
MKDDTGLAYSGATSMPSLIKIRQTFQNLNHEKSERLRQHGNITSLRSFLKQGKLATNIMGKKGA